MPQTKKRSVSTKGGASGEHCHAFNVLKASFSVLPYPSTRLDNSLWATGEITASWNQTLARLLPSGEGWLWKQAKAASTLYLPELSTNMTIRKLIPRKRVASPLSKAPSFKLWEFTEATSSRTIYWCEKGEMISTEPKVEDYYFLASFMTKEVALSIWPPRTLLKNCTTMAFKKDV